MVKNTFIYVLTVVFVGVAVWFFMQKISKNDGSSSIDSFASNSPIPTATAVEIKSDSGPAQNTSWIKTKEGLQYQDVVVGSGEEAKPGDMIAAHYTGTLVDGTKFDSSYDRGQPFAFVLGGGMVIKGWDLGLVGMKVGGKRKLIIPPQLGYGSSDHGPIPGNSTLLFDVELMAVKGQGQ